MRLSSSMQDTLKLVGIVVVMCGIAVVATCVALPHAACVPDSTYSVTPTLLWDQVDSDVLAGYTLYYRENGGPLIVLTDLLCEWETLDDEGLYKLRHCRGGEFDIPVQRYCPACAPLHEYEFTVKALDLFDARSTSYAATVSICMPPLREF